MATVVARLEAILTAQTKDFEQKMDKSEHRMSGVGKAAAVAGTAIIGGLAVGLEKSVHAAMDAQVSQARLEAAFKTAHLSAAKYEPQVRKLETSSRKLGFTEEDVHTALGSLIVATHSMKDASKDLSVAQDIARFKHIDLAQATKMLTMAQAGSQRATKQLGLNVTALTDAQDKVKVAYNAAKDALDQNSGSLKKGTAAQQEQYSVMKNNIDTVYAGNLAVAKMTDKQATAAKVIDLVREKLGGQADAYSKTAAGSMEQFKAQLNFLEISMGTALIPILTQVSMTMANLTAFFSKHTTATKIMVAALAALGVTLITVSVATKVVTAATRVYTAAQWLLNAALTANPIGLVIVALAALGVALVVAYYKVKFFREGVQATFNWIKENWPLIAGIIGGPIGIALEQIITRRNQIAHAFEVLPGMIGNAIGGAIGVLKSKLEEIFDWHRIVKWIRDALGFGSPSPHFMAIGHDMVSSMVKGVGDAAGLLKDAVFGLAKEYSIGLPGKLLGGGGSKTPAQSGVGSASAQGAERIALQMMPSYGWGTNQFPSLRDLWMGESGWSVNAYNKSSHAQGIPQLLPSAHPGAHPGFPDWPPLNAAAQIKWGLDYIKSKYGSPAAAYSAWKSRSPHWYDQGGWLPPGLSLAMNNTGRPERVLGPGEGGNIIHNHNYNGPVVQDQQFIRYLRGLEANYRRSNGRPAFGT